MEVGERAMTDHADHRHTWHQLDEDEYRWRLELAPAEPAGGEPRADGSGQRWADAIEQGLRLLA